MPGVPPSPLGGSDVLDGGVSTPGGGGPFFSDGFFSDGFL